VVRFIGDVHGYYKRYRNVIRPVKNSIQVGDMGVGFYNIKAHRYYANPPYDSMTRGNHRFIRGNHDNPEVCRNQSQWIKDGHYEDGMMFIGGALSIDKHLRNEGADWWADEELSVNELYALTDKYIEAKPEIMVTHDCPENIARVLFHTSMKHDYPSRTRQAFEGMFYHHKPKYWIFGHWHMSSNFEIEGTRFICLNEMEYIDL
jgi:hypothetical protein